MSKNYIWRVPPQLQAPSKVAVTGTYVPPAPPTSRVDRGKPLGHFRGMARRMPIGTAMGVIFLILLITP